MTRGSTTADVLDGPLGTCRHRLRWVLDELDGRRGVSRDELHQIVERSDCAQGHDLHFAALMSGLIELDGEGGARLARRGADWLDTEGRPSPTWRTSIAVGATPLRAWQVDALTAWSDHARRGVVEAVTGTGKSRVGVEATREALSHDYSVVIAVPTRDLVEQWVATLRAHQVPGVGIVGGGKSGSFGECRVLVGTVQSLYLDPPTRPDGKVLLVADECHRYGAGQWRQVLHGSYRRRLGLTATFERNDDGLDALLAYFGGSPVYRIGFDRAIADGVVAHYDVKLYGVGLRFDERRDYDAAHDTVVDSRMHLLSAGFPADPFGLFLHRVQEAAEDEDGREDPTVVDMARRYLKAFSERIRIVSSARAKMDAVRQLAPRVSSSAGTLLFTRTVEAADEIAEILVEEHVACQPIHSRLTPTERRERLAALKARRLKAVAAPTVLDEGVDVPSVDLAVVLGGSKSRRQMIQRMGRVLRLKSDGGKATFIVVYAIDTIEDLTINDGQEGCLDLIVKSADGVETLTAATLGGTTQGPVQNTVDVDLDVDIEVAPEVIEEGPGAAPFVITDEVLRQYRTAHGCSTVEAARGLRVTLDDFWRLHGPIASEDWSTPPWGLEEAEIDLRVDARRVLRYRSQRADRQPWPLVKQVWARTRSQRIPQAWRSRAVVMLPPDRRAVAALSALGPCGSLDVGDTAIEEHRSSHGGSAEESRLEMRRLLTDLEVDRDRCGLDSLGRLIVGRSGFAVTVEPESQTVCGYSSSGQRRTYSDYVDLGCESHQPAVEVVEPPVDDPLEIDVPGDLLDYLDFATIHLPQETMRTLAPHVDRGRYNRWDLDRALRARLLSDAAGAEMMYRTASGDYAIRGSQNCWAFRADGLVASVVDPEDLQDIESEASSVIVPEVVVETAPTVTTPAEPVVTTTPNPSPPVSEVVEVVPVGQSTGSGVVADLDRLVELKIAGFLTDEEFTAAKSRLLA